MPRIGRKGVIYILHNPSLRDECLKIGMTERSPAVRARELSARTNVPQEYVVAYWRHVMDIADAETAIHEYLDAYRVNDRREFFRLPLEEAIRAIRRIADDPARIERWSGRHVLGRSESVRWVCLAGDLFLFSRYKSIFHTKPELIDVWQARDDNDELLITSDQALDPGSLAPETWTAEDWVLRPGDRITWVSRSRDGVLREPPPRTAHIEFSEPTRVVGLSIRPRVAPEKMPVLFSMLAPDASPDIAHPAWNEVLQFGMPRTWAPYDESMERGWKSPGWFTADDV